MLSSEKKNERNGYRYLFVQIKDSYEDFWHFLPFNLIVTVCDADTDNGISSNRFCSFFLLVRYGGLRRKHKNNQKNNNNPDR